MPITFTPQFFSRPTTASTVTALHPVSSVTDSPVPKKYSMQHNIPKHGTPQYASPIAQSPSLSNASQHYADIDWTKKESIMQDGTRIKFGAPR
jgi:hypothetical protein